MGNRRHRQGQGHQGNDDAEQIGENTRRLPRRGLGLTSRIHAILGLKSAKQAWLTEEVTQRENPLAHPLSIAAEPSIRPS